MASQASAREDVNVEHAEQPEVQEHPALSAPHSVENEDDRQSATGSQGNQDLREVSENSDGSSSDSETEGSGSEDSESGGEELESVPRADLDRAESPDPAQEGGADSITGGYSFSGSGLYEWPVSPALSVPRTYTHFTAEVTGLKSVFGTSQDLSDRTALLIGKSGRRGIWAAEGVARSEHAAIWPTSLKFIMYDVCITEMHIRPPFSAFQQTVLAKLGVAPSQLHPNGWAFLRAYELICRWLERPVSADLFFNLFEIQRNNGNKNSAPGRAHVSFRSVRGNRVFQLYSDSLKGNGWKSRFYWVVPTDAATKNLIARLSDDGQTVESSAFQLGWSMEHYDHPPGHYRVANESLSEEDQRTKKMLIACADALPFADKPEKRGFHTPSLVHAKNAPRVLAAISRDCFLVFLFVVLVVCFSNRAPLFSV